MSTTVMIVDDDGINLETVKEALVTNGYEAICIQNPQNALEVAIKQSPDFIVLDVVMPERNGIDLCRDFKLHPLTKDIPIILLTSSTENKHVIASLHLGCVEFLQKPLASQELIDVIFKHDIIHKIHDAMRPAKEALEDLVKRYS